MLARREVVAGAGALTVTGALTAAGAPADARPAAAARLAALEARSGGRLGVCALDSRSGLQFGWRQDARFAMCSTFKMLAVAAVLHKVDRGEEHLDRWIAYGEADLLEYAPVTRAHVAQGGLRLEDLCAAAVELSDNTAANLILTTLGGPAGVTRFARLLGDRMTHLDHNEPALNVVAPGATNDTTTPTAMVGNLRMLLYTPMLTPDSRERLTRWMVGCRTGLDALRHGAPISWTIGDKTGSGPKGETNDIAVMWPADRKPIFVAAYFGGGALHADERKAVLAEVGKIVSETFRVAGA